MNLLDLVFAIPMVYFIWRGYRRGIIFELASLAGLVLGCYAAVKFSRYVADIVGLSGESALLIAFFITFIAVLLLSVFIGKCVQGLVKLVKAGWLDNLLGAVLGWVKCVCVLGVVVAYVSIIDSQQLILKPQWRQQSFFYKPINKAGNKLIGTLHGYVEARREASQHGD